MAKNIVLCSDGTGNQGGKGYGTNIWRLYQAIDKTKPEEQIACYDDGVGSEDSLFRKAIGGAIGLGLGRNIRELYTFLVKNYEKGDKIYLFGFSRGAYTIRSLAGLISYCGIIKVVRSDGAKKSDDELKEDIKNTYNAYKYLHYHRIDKEKNEDKNKRFKSVGITYQTDWRVKGNRDKGDGENWDPYDIKIECVGVWDTVDAIGVPVDELREWVVKGIGIIQKVIKRAAKWFPLLKFIDNKPSKSIQHGFQALSIDDERRTFHPLLWEQSGNENIEQVWFSGVHSNVGGGYPKDQLALVSLDWMMDRIEKKTLGLEFLPDLRKAYREQKDGHGKIYDSRSGVAAYYRYRPRNIEALWEQYNNGQKGNPIKVHHSVIERIERSTSGYAPVNLPSSFQDVDGDKVDDKKYIPAESALKDAWKTINRRGLLYLFFVFSSLISLMVVVRLERFAPITDNEYNSIINSIIGRISYMADYLTFSSPLYLTISDVLSSLFLPIFLFFRSITPDALNGRYEALVNHSGWFLLFILVAMTMLWLRRRFVAKINSKGQEIWSPLINGNSGQSAAEMPKKYWPLTIAGYALMVFIIVSICLQYLSHVSLDESRKKILDCGGNGSFCFDIRNHEYDTGKTLYKGKSYYVTVVAESNWSDEGNAKASYVPDGFKETDLISRIAEGLKRSPGDHWLKMLAQVGDGPIRSIGSRALVTPRETGTLKLFVNDVDLVFFPWGRWYLYGNNQGVASVRITLATDG